MLASGSEMGVYDQRSLALMHWLCKCRKEKLMKNVTCPEKLEKGRTWDVSTSYSPLKPYFRVLTSGAAMETFRALEATKRSPQQELEIKENPIFSSRKQGGDSTDP